MATAILSRPGASGDFLGHPKGVFVCFFTEMWERFSFYGMKALLLLYLLKHHGFSDDMGYELIGAYGGLVYAVPVIGGLVADRWLGMRKSVTLGAVLLVLGHLGMAWEGHPATSADGTVVRDAAAMRSRRTAGSRGSACPCRSFWPHRNIARPASMPTPPAPNPYFQP